jgi:hypothetical protein
MNGESPSPTVRTERTVFKRSGMKTIVEVPPQSAPTPLASSNGSGTLDARIHTCAYELFETRGCQEGHALDDWLQAEREMEAPQSS